MNDMISREQAIDAMAELQGRASSKGERTGISKAWKRIKQLPSIQPEIIRCKDCKYWVPGYITDNDDFIPPKCGEWQQMVGHSSDDYCSLAERGEQNEP